MEKQSPLIKVCGLTREQDVQLCLDLGVDLLGFIFERQSPRCIDPEIVAAFPRGEASRVGIFVRHSVSQIQVIRKTAGLDLVQLHGDYSPAQCEALNPAAVIKVFWPTRYQDAEAMLRDLRLYASCSRFFLFDAGLSGGGHGRPLETDWIQDVAVPCPWFLAGGVCAENVHYFITQFQPYGIDMNSGVENSPGFKNREKLKMSLEAINQRSEVGDRRSEGRGRNEHQMIQI